MSELLQFLTENPVDQTTDEVAISNRFKNAKGELLKFKIRAMSGKEYTDYQKKAINVSHSKKGKSEFDATKFYELIVINHTVDPNFKDAASLEKMGLLTPEQFLNKVLLAGELEALAKAIQDLSGFNIDLDELREEAKN